MEIPEHLASLESLDGRRTVRLLGTSVQEGERFLDVLGISWSLEGEERTLENLAQQPIRFGPEEIEPAEARARLTRGAFAGVVALGLSETDQLVMPSAYLPGFDGSIADLVARITPSGRWVTAALEDGVLGWSELTLVGLRDVREVGDDVLATLVHRIGDDECEAEVVLARFPDEDPERLRAYATAMRAVLHAVCSVVEVERQRALALERWMAPELLEDPALANPRDFAAAWCARPELAELLP